MFRVKIEIDEFNNKAKNLQPYFILTEVNPLLHHIDGKTVFYQSNYSSLRKARDSALFLSNYFEHCFFFLDLIYTKIKQSELCNLLEKTVKLTT